MVAEAYQWQGWWAAVMAAFASYFAIPRAQSPFALNGEKRRSRRSEERIVEFEDMVQDVTAMRTVNSY